MKGDFEKLQKMPSKTQVVYINRETGKYEIEKIYGDRFLTWLYGTYSGSVLRPLFIRRWFSSLYGRLQSSSWSRRKIPIFIKQFEIDMDEFLPKEEDLSSHYRHFNDFFARAFLPGRRPFVEDRGSLAAPAEGRYAAYSNTSDQTEIAIKGHRLPVSRLLGNSHWADYFSNGVLIVIRLCPIDYHRVHYPDKGVILCRWHLPGTYHSVGLKPLQRHPEILISNERFVEIIETEHFGPLAMIEVGAIGVGSVLHQKNVGDVVLKGEEKSRFLFGGSTVILLAKSQSLQIDGDLGHNLTKGYETLVKLGTRIGGKIFAQGDSRDV
jgi:phosphatidylserine decarboxylase